MTGNMKVEGNADDITIYIDENKLFSINYDVISQHPRTGSFGVRWVGAAVKLVK
ncbi:hypothetical protein D3C78_1535250 [compost metagenome]